MSNSIGKPEACKPAKPYEHFPLFPHATKRWAKKIKGRLHYFGPWDNWQAALERFQYENDYLQQGKTPPPRDQTACSVETMVNTMLEQRDSLVESGELTKRSFTDYKRTGKLLVEKLGRHTSVESLKPSDFIKLRADLSKRLGLVAVGNEIGRVRVFLKFAYTNDLIERPVKLGDGFAKPSRKTLKREKLSKPAKVFTVEELQTLYHAADAQMKAFMLLALNGGMGNSDIGQFESKHIVGNWVEYPRPKTLVDRKFPLWKETAKAIAEAKQTKHPELPFVFVTKYGKCWYKDAKDSPLSAEFRKLCNKCKLHHSGRGFYALRHTFRTVADGCRDQKAINHIMGHSDESMAATYTEWIDPARLQAVVDHVHAWVKPMLRKPAKSKGGAK